MTSETHTGWFPRTLAATRQAIASEGKLTPKQLALAVGLVTVAALVLGGTQFLIGPNTTVAGYLTILFLLTIVRVQSWKARLYSAAWSLAVALVGFFVGSIGIWATLVALLVVSLVQGFVTVGESALLTRSPMNVIAFASLAQGNGELWHVLLGSAIGIAVILGFSAISKPTKRDRGPEIVTARARFGYGLSTGLGSIAIVVVSDLVGFPYTGWALLSYCVMLAVGVDGAHHRALLRIIGSVCGALLSVLITTLPTPFPTIAAGICMVLCVAYITAGHYAAFILFLTPAILLTTSSEHTTVQLGLYRLEAVAVATVFALLASWLVQRYVVRDPGHLSAADAGQSRRRTSPTTS